VGKGQSAIYVTRSGWPREIPILGGAGEPAWRLEEFENGVDGVAWVDLDGSGASTLLVGLNGGGGIRAFHDGGRKRWGMMLDANIWTVTGIDAAGDRPGRAIYCDGEKVSVLDADGREVGEFSTRGHYVTTIAAAELDRTGARQVVSVWPANVGTLDYAVGTDLGGKVLWKYPVNADETSSTGTFAVAADVTGDGAKEWILAPGHRELVVLDSRGRLVARIHASGRGFSAWAAAGIEGRPGWIVAAEAGKASAFTLAPGK
ncbi:MAG: hypothetical protein JO303_11670, partial [Caulobacteraceae bacterium]|nr:hypothetical protein [Caulobacteraceae bacterium]